MRVDNGAMRGCLLETDLEITESVGIEGVCSPRMQGLGAMCSCFDDAGWLEAGASTMAVCADSARLDSTRLAITATVLGISRS